MLGTEIFIIISIRDKKYIMSNSLGINTNLLSYNGSYMYNDKLIVVPISIPKGDLKYIDKVQDIINDKLSSLKYSHELLETFILSSM
jgi:hypothetical protein